MRALLTLSAGAHFRPSPRQCSSSFLFQLLRRQWAVDDSTWATCCFFRRAFLSGLSLSSTRISFVITFRTVVQVREYVLLLQSVTSLRSRVYLPSNCGAWVLGASNDLCCPSFLCCLAASSVDGAILRAQCTRAGMHRTTIDARRKEPVTF